MHWIERGACVCAWVSAFKTNIKPNRKFINHLIRKNCFPFFSTCDAYANVLLLLLLPLVNMLSSWKMRFSCARVTFAIKHSKTNLKVIWFKTFRLKLMDVCFFLAFSQTIRRTKKNHRAEMRLKENIYVYCEGQRWVVRILNECVPCCNHSSSMWLNHLLHTEKTDRPYLSHPFIRNFGWIKCNPYHVNAVVGVHNGNSIHSFNECFGSLTTDTFISKMRLDVPTNCNT